jgi:hypothetical protein
MKWALDLNTSLENLSFQIALSFRIASTSIMMPSHYLETYVSVHVTHVIFQHTISNMQ